MVILIGGVGYAGKTLLAQRLLEKYKYPYLSIDHLKMGLYRADIGCGFMPCDSTEHIGEKIWPILKGIIMTSIENEQNLIVEGVYLLPQKIKELELGYLKNIISFYLVFSEAYIAKFFKSKIIHNRCVIENRGYSDSNTAADYIVENNRQKERCLKHGGKYFEIDGEYHKEIDMIYSWINLMKSNAVK
ncbi:MAG: 2-phosphoglycerate kinase [Defluviitaleaceae bacterium]|nr:2-phosphoglycerate kinase [Defluviitaleaceae bacterium]